VLSPRVLLPHAAMSVLLETSLGNLVVDLDWKGCQKASLNFLALCTTKYYNNTLVYKVETDYICYAGDPTGTGRGGESIFGQLYGPQASVFPDEKTGEDFGGEARSGALGLVSMRAEPTGGHASAFSITLRDEPTAYSKVETPFGRVVEGLDVLDKLSKTFLDDKGRPLADLRILHTYVLVDPLGAKKLAEPLGGGDWPSPQLSKPTAEVSCPMCLPT
jgi:peptidyl-prolyl cis-trans isomerase-like 4